MTESIAVRAGEMPQTYSVMVLQPGRVQRVMVLSPLVGFRVHFKDRSLLCPRCECKACQLGWATKYVGYLVVHDGSQRRLMRLTEAAALDVERQGLAYSGSIWEMSKPRSRSPIEIRETGTIEPLPGARHTSGDVMIRVALLHGLGVIDDENSASIDAEVSRRSRLVLDGLLIS